MLVYINSGIIFVNIFEAFMRKLFLAICFSLCLAPSCAFAAIRSVANMTEAQNAGGENQLQISQELLDEKAYFRNMTQEQMREYLKDRLFHVVTTELEKTDALGGDSAVDVQKSALQLEIEAQNKKSIFEKIYDRAMRNLIDITEPEPKAKIYTQEDSQNMRPQAADEAEKMQKLQMAQRQAWLNSNVPMIEAELPPYNQKTLIPAQEHIPYLFSRIELLPDGLIKFTDTIVVVANGQKLKESIQRAFPKFVFDREGKRQKVEFNLLNVSINGNPVQYKLIDRNNYVFMEPVDKIELVPGVYEYQFDYTIDNQIFSYDEFDEFYWNLTGSVWNLVIARAGAVVVLPPNTQILGQMALSGYNGYWRDDTVAISQEQDNVLGFVSQTPLFIGQAMEMIVSLPKGAVSDLSWSKKFLRLVNAYGDILFAAFGLSAIFLSYLISWKFIRQNKKTPVKGIFKDASLLRYLAKGVIDKKTFGAFLLDLYRKNIIDIEENDDNILLVKKTDNLTCLSSAEKKVLRCLFGQEEVILNVNSFTAGKIDKACKLLKNAVCQKIKQLCFKLNFGYVVFGVGMLLFAEAAIAYLNYDFAYNFLFLLLATLVLAFCLWLFQHKFASGKKNKAARIAAVFLAAATAFVMLAIVNLATVLLLAAALLVIQEYGKLYVQRDGLLAAYVKEAQNFAELLKNKADALRLGKDFAKNQAAVMALDCEADFLPAAQNKNVYKLDIVAKLLEKI